MKLHVVLSWLIAAATAGMLLAIALHPAVATEGSRATLLWAFGSLALYAAGTWAISSARNPDARTSFRAGLRWGLAGGVASAAHLPIEDFVRLPPLWTRVVDVGFFLALFTCFVIPAVIATRRTHRFGYGVLAAVCAAPVAMCLTVVTGYITNFIFVERERTLLYGDFLRSGMHDPTAFVFENALDAAGTHLFEGPIIALVLGTIASAITSVIRK